jgi:hypothetical protein
VVFNIYKEKEAVQRPQRANKEKLLENRSEKLLPILIHSMNLERSLLKEPLLPTEERRGTPVKYAVIPLLPNVPGSNHEDFHEEGCVVLLLSSVHHAEEVKIKALVQVEVVPAGLTEGASEE